VFKWILQHSFAIQNVLKYGNTLTPFLFNSASEYTIRRVQGNQEELKLNGTHQHLSYGDDVNIVEENIDAIKKNKKPY
jgi:hypothetical protein